MRDPAEAPDVGRLKRRADFLRVAKGDRWHAQAATVQGVASPARHAPARVGFTLTRKVGSAVIRNRARRRLKEALRLADGLPLEPGHDYVIVGRIAAIRLPFDQLRRELVSAFEALRTRAAARRSGGKRRARESTETR